MATPTVSIEAYEIDEATDRRQFISWPAIFAGNAVTGGFILVLLPLGAAAGLAMTSPYAGQSASGSTIGVAAVLWLAFMYLFSTFAGGYVAGRLRPRLADADLDEVKFRDGMNGLVVWGVGMIISALFTYMTLTAALGTATQALGQAAGGVAQGAASVAGTAARQQGLPSVDGGYIADLFLRSTGGNTAAAQNTQQRSTEDVRGEISRIVAASAASGQVSDEDRAYLATLVAQQTGVSQDEARKRVDTSIQRVNAMREEAIADTKAAAETARKAASQTAFWTALMSLLAGIAAYYGAVMGGTHRDDGRIVRARLT